MLKKFPGAALLLAVSLAAASGAGKEGSAAAARSAGGVTLASLSHRVLPVEGVVQVTVRGTGFVESAHAVCQVSNMPGAAVSFDTHTVPAIVVNSTTLLCTP